MIKAVVTVFVFAAMSVSTTMAQQQPDQHAPTLQQCRSDRDLWATEMKDKQRIPARTLGYRQHEMEVCMMIIDLLPDQPAIPEGSGTLEEARHVLSEYIVALKEYELAVSNWHKYMVVRLGCAEELENRLIAFMARHNLALDDAADH